MIIYLHIGIPKSGTTYLQTLLYHNRSTLARNGVLWPGRRWSDQVHAVTDLLDASPHGYRAPEVEGAWSRCVAEVLAWEGHAAVMSMEWLTSARPRMIRRILRSFAPHEVRVILTERDFARTVPAVWQESMQNSRTWTWQDYLADVTAEDPRQSFAGRRLFARHDAARVLRKWGRVIPPDRMSLVTVPPAGSDPGLLWERFAQAVGLDPADYETDLGARNGSLGAASAEVMRRVNIATHERGLTWAEAGFTLKRVLAKEVLALRTSHEPKITLPAAHRAWAEEQATRIIAGLEDLGVRVFGDLCDLMPAGESADDFPAVSDTELVDAAVDGLVGMAQSLTGDLSRLREDMKEAERERDAAVRERDNALRARDRALRARDRAVRERDRARRVIRRHRELPPVERVKRCVVELSEQVSVLGVGLNLYRKARAVTRRVGGGQA